MLIEPDLLALKPTGSRPRLHSSLKMYVALKPAGLCARGRSLLFQL